MDLTSNISLKENYTFLVLTKQGQVLDATELGLYDRDTRFLSIYRWNFADEFQILRRHERTPAEVHLHYSKFDRDFQRIAVERVFRVYDSRLEDRIVVSNTSGEPVQFTAELTVGSDFADMFEARGLHDLRAAQYIEEPYSNVRGRGFRLSRTTDDEVTVATGITCDPMPSELTEGVLRFPVSLSPRESCKISVTVEIDNPVRDSVGVASSSGAEFERTEGGSRPPGAGETPARPSYESWREPTLELARTLEPQYRQVFDRAVDDMRALLLSTSEGLVPAAGIPWFVAAFGRDSLLASLFLLPWWTIPAEGTTRYLARYQATETDPRRASTPGKIMHELRFGELSRTGVVPFGPYYGTADATPLFIMTLANLARHGTYERLVTELRPAWEAALNWIIEYGDIDGDGLLEYSADPTGKDGGLPIQSWKDSNDSMSHRDGSLAVGPIAPSEVQGYVFAAFHAAADLYRMLRENDRAQELCQRAADLSVRFHDTFWIEKLGTYAMALDGQKHPLEVRNSNAGHLLWSGIVPETAAERLVDSLFSDELWTGWGLRTLGSGEVRYNPVSYHNGSVWPHDTAMAAQGLAQYGFYEQAVKLRNALFDLAATQTDLRLPELVGGYARTDGPPVTYPVACRPQAWDAAALIALAPLSDAASFSGGASWNTGAPLSPAANHPHK